MDGTLQMLNNVWSSLVSKFGATKKCYNDLEGNMIQANNHLNDGIDALTRGAKDLEKKFWAINYCYDNLHNKFTKQQQTIHTMDRRIAFYSCWVKKLKNKMKEATNCWIDGLEQHISGQDNQVKILQAHPTTAERGRCCCGEDTPKVISCCCFLRS